MILKINKLLRELAPLSKVTLEDKIKFKMQKNALDKYERQLDIWSRLEKLTGANHYSTGYRLAGKNRNK